MKLYDLIKKYGWTIMPVISSLGVELLSDGNIYFVDSNATNKSNANDGFHGDSFDYPFSTLNYAVSRCTSNQGDIILLAEGHAETIEDTGTASGTTTDECCIDKAGIHIIGLGSGSRIPTFTLEGATDAAIVVLAAGINVHIKNIKIISNLADVAAGLTLSATSDGAVIEDCIFMDGAAAKELVIGIAVAADCDNITIKNNVFTTVAAGGCASAIDFAGGSDNSKITGNIINGTYSNAGIDLEAAASVNVIIMHNVICNQGGDALVLHTNTTGIYADNYLGGTTSIAVAVTGNDEVWQFENYVTGEDGNSGLLDPAADADA